MKSLERLDCDEAVMQHTPTQVQLLIEAGLTLREDIELTAPKGIREEELTTRYEEHAQLRRVRTVDSAASVQYGGIPDDRRVTSNRQITTQQVVHNYCSRDVVIYDRTGIPMVMVPETRSHEKGLRCIVIRRELFFSSEDDVSRTLRMLEKKSEACNDDLNWVQRALRSRQKTFRFGKKLVVEYTVDEHELSTHPAGCYHPKTDLLLCYGREIRHQPHPMSDDYVADIGKTPIPLDHQSADVFVRLRYVNNDLTARPKYMVMAGRVQKLHPTHSAIPKTVLVKDKHGNSQKKILDAYVEITKIHGSSSDCAEVIRISMDEAKEAFGLFDTLAHAQEPVLTYEQRVSALKAEAAAAKHEHLLSISCMKAELEISKAEIKQLKAKLADDSDDHKEHREEQAHRRKQSMEYLKFGTGLTLTLMGVIPAALKLIKELEKDGK